jgi:hypothetical protein
MVSLAIGAVALLLFSLAAIPALSAPLFENRLNDA